MLAPTVRAALANLATASRPTCAYVYDRATLVETVARVRTALPAGARLLYALKANSHPRVVATLAGVTDGLEVASGGELELALATGASRVVFGGPAKTDQELRAAVRHGALLHVESGHELRRLALIARSLGITAQVALRVNRPTAAPDGHHRMTGLATPFGIEEAQLVPVVALAAELPEVRLVGFHLHAVSNSMDAAGYASFVADAVRWSVATASFELSYLNVGGGLGVDYTGPAALDLSVLREGLAAAVAELPSGVELVFEPGRFLVADAGWYAAEVLDLKSTHGRWFAVLRGGTHHFRLPAAWGYSHPFTVLPVESWPYPFARAEVTDVPVDVVGELCTPRDVLSRQVRVDRLRIGDVLVFGRAGGYGWDISHHDFLHHPHPDFLIL